MALLDILKWPDPRLTRPCARVPDPVALAGLAQDMLDTMYVAPGRGLAGPQVGQMLRIFVMDTTWKEGERSPVICVNPRIVDRSDSVAEGTEACLSIPGVDMSVPRSEWIDMTWTDTEGRDHAERLTGFDAVCAQHEHDHLDGIVIFDRIPPSARMAAEQAYTASRG
ncbi:peptide deformylase [Chachezhania antarctica]|uniref:peptide deformylase n=1 Tax=Chachezhania antarctica TaxID=2340860 RepID=UPI000EAE2290|nr:peptide deformylase [Chachezhania antarctica]|tara:strand:+ start:5652 stop:6152 length:501 start_codon:yes stop_codon:yes gene_type:complete